ncbi:Eco57I restriction-modification methylase domain-containing protein [Pseudomonas monsensis]|uniref:Eco57I restriction-modification methylase domain-containing protein n=1 Tax=Pseudomonas monsensis TaxID=2745509 RepID=UPI002ABCB959|nr:N-6 DNA methylase [Pseudomonas monsensis]MDZ3829470.1 N-6 DNA methylase [Pseudomonas monsensis]
MSSSTDLAILPANTRRYGDVDQQKSAGVIYTPADFAAFVADQMVSLAELPAQGEIRVLDPAVGDGALLEALLMRMPADILNRIRVVGYDTDPGAVARASVRLRKVFPDVSLLIEEKDFLDHVLSLSGDANLSSSAAQAPMPFDLVIANPPYVRTQIMGGEQAQQLAQRFGLTGRVDLYYPFLLGISQVLTEGGVAGVITSNRFMTTKSGQAVRRALLSQFKIDHVWDFGDTKLFDAAVLPAVLLARGIKAPSDQSVGEIAFSTIYECKENALIHASDVFEALAMSDNTIVSTPDGRNFSVRHGLLENGDHAEGVWRISTETGDQWLATVSENTWNTFRRIGKIRVGVKSTADKVFVRSDWSDLPGGRPELLRPLITRHCARQFKARVPSQAKHMKEIMYPHEATSGGGRKAVDLSLYPLAARYLKGHRDVLEARSYVIKAGRAWYELWVPQDPAAWSSPKIVFPDISEKPTFWMDTEGGIVNGECYWIQCEREDENDLLWLALAVANSTFIESFYDHRFNNKLYAGRRRFITQYVEQFPLPDPARKETQAIIALAKEIHAELPSSAADQMISELNALVWQVFGLNVEEDPA